MTEHELWVKTHNLDRATGKCLQTLGTHTGSKVSKKGLKTSQADQKWAGVAYINHCPTLSTPASAPSAHENTWPSSVTSLVLPLAFLADISSLNSVSLGAICL